MSTNPRFPDVPAFSPVAQILNADASNQKTLYTCATTNGVLIGRLRATNSDPSNAYTLQFAITVSGTDYIIGESQVPAGAGTNGSTGWKDILADLNLSSPITLANGETLKVKSKTTVTGSYAVSIRAEGAPL